MLLKGGCGNYRYFKDGWFLFQFGGNDFIDPTNEMHCNKLVRDLRTWLGVTEVALVERIKPETRIIPAIKNDTIVVSANGDGNFKSIREALDCAQDGMTILVKYGEYHEHFVVDKNKGNE